MTVKKIPLLPLREYIVFPHMVVPLPVGREKSIAAIEEAMARDKEILLSAQRTGDTNDPASEDIYEIGTIGTIIQLLRLNDGVVKILVEGKRRARIKKFLPNDAFLECEAEVLDDTGAPTVELEALVRSTQAAFGDYAKLNRRIPPELLVTVQTVEDPSRLADTIVAYLTSMKLADRQAVLETIDPHERLEKTFELLNNEIEILEVQKKIRTRVKKQMERNQKEYYLNEQMQAIQRELGDRDEFRNELAEVEEKLKSKKLSKEAQARVKKELKKLRMMQPMSAEATVVRNYIDWVLALPWEDKSEENYNLAIAEQVLDEDHYGLRKIKERIIEYLAVQALVRKLRGPVLCLVGPPGVGKTSLAKSIARATGRKFVRLSLGGVRDEAEVRGHRRTYIGALPGRIVQSLKKAGANNPVFLLDEIDKMSSDFRGDPASAMLEVLDPEQNHSFNDHYLDLDYDLSDVMFVTTANSLSGIPVPLQDRMEIIHLSGYTEFEKLNIAVKYLVPRQLEEAGLKGVNIDFTENAIRTIIHNYTKESGVRNLEREIGSVARKIARQVVADRAAHAPTSIEAVTAVEKNVEKNTEKNPQKNTEKSSEKSAEKGVEAAAPVTTPASEVAATAPNAPASPVGPDLEYKVLAKAIPKYLGPPKYRTQRANSVDLVGLTNGLAYTSYGGTTLECEVAVVSGKGKLVITGLLEKGMQESAHAAMSYVRARQAALGLDEDFHSKFDVHVHFPEFVPKDGPSAGITIATSMASALMRAPVRRNIAMTGEITLRGRVLPIGGLKEKMLAAHRAGIDTVIIPRENQKDLRDIPRRVLLSTRVVMVEHMDDVLREALVLPDDRVLFDTRPRPPEYNRGEYIDASRPPAASDSDASEAPGPIAPTVEGPGAHQ